jgi:uncharacterized membrane protein YdjX (TVP38/TMEM64 family)
MKLKYYILIGVLSLIILYFVIKNILILSGDHQFLLFFAVMFIGVFGFMLKKMRDEYQAGNI